MKEGRVSHLRTKSRGQAMVEFVIALPVLLFIIFGIIEFARMVFAWMAVQNAARFGIRYAVTYRGIRRWVLYRSRQLVGGSPC